MSKTRSIKPYLAEALKAFPVVLLTGARQVGKSTLALELFDNYITFDDGEMRLFAKENPKDFLRTIHPPVCLDEIQKVPSLLESIKMQVDRTRRNGDFLLTGSSNVLDFQDARETLAGRMALLELYPLSSKERHDKPFENVIEQILSGDLLSAAPVSHETLSREILDGGYPEILKLEGFAKELWFSSYVATYIERDARDLADIRDLDSFIRFVHILASRSATLLNKSSLAQETGVKNETIQHYLSIMTRIYQATLLRPYSANIGKRFVKSPKLFLNDTGVLCHLLKIHSPKALEESPYSGQIYESYLFNELRKHLAYSRTRGEIYHYRTTDKKEIDFIIETGEKLLAIEVKRSSSVRMDDFKHIVDFQKRVSRDVLGILFYTGERPLQLAPSLVALPMGVFL